MPLFSLRYFAALVVFFIYSGVIFGQSQPARGTIVLNDGTVKNGILELKSNYQNSRAISFISEDTVTRIYHPFEIESYQVVGGKYYVSKEIEIEGETHQVFLEYLVKGIVNLYFLEDRQNDNYFIEKEGQLYHLSNGERGFISDRDGTTKKWDPNERSYPDYKTTTNQYKGALRYLFNEDAQIFSRVANLPFEFKAMVDITKDYHNAVCKDYECIDFTTQSTQNYLFIEPVVAYGLSSISMSNYDGKLMDNSLEVGVYFRRRIKKSQYRSVVLGVIVSQYSFEGDYNPDLYMDVKYGSIRFPILYEWILSAKDSAPYIQFGFSNAFVPVVDQYIIYERTTPDLIDRHLEFGLNLGLGWRIIHREKNSLSIRLDTDGRMPAGQLGSYLDKRLLLTARFGLSYSFLAK